MQPMQVLSLHLSDDEPLVMPEKLQKKSYKGLGFKSPKKGAKGEAGT